LRVAPQKHIVLAESRGHQQHCNQVTARDAYVDLAGNFVWDDAFWTPSLFFLAWVLWKERLGEDI
jgi:hypothetical protein